jgi:hypothetical protein
VEAPGSPSWGDRRASKSLMPRGTFWGESAGTAQDRRLWPGWAAPGPSGLPTGHGLIQALDPGGVEVAAAVFVPLGVDPHPEGVFPLRGIVVVAGPVVAFGAEFRQLGETVLPPGLVRRGPGVPGPPGDRREAVPVGRRQGAVGCFAPAFREPPGHRPFLLVFGAVTGEPALGPDPGDDLVHAGKASGGGAGVGNSGGAVCGFESRVLAAGDDQVVPDEGGMHAHEGGDASQGGRRACSLKEARR